MRHIASKTAGIGVLIAAGGGRTAWIRPTNSHSHSQITDAALFAQMKSPVYIPLFVLFSSNNRVVYHFLFLFTIRDNRTEAHIRPTPDISARPMVILLCILEGKMAIFVQLKHWWCAHLSFNGRDPVGRNTTILTRTIQCKQNGEVDGIFL